MANFDWWELLCCVDSSGQIWIGGNCHGVPLVQGKFGFWQDLCNISKNVIGLSLDNRKKMYLQKTLLSVF